MWRDYPFTQRHKTTERAVGGWVGDEVGGDKEGGLGVLDKILKRGRVDNIGGLHKKGGEVYSKQMIF